MTEPSILDQDEPLLPDAPERELPTEAGLAGGGESLILPGVVIEQQRYSYWCWSAAGVCVARKYDPATRWNQCLFATTLLNLGLDCCQAPNEPSCNQTADLGDAFTRLGVFRGVQALDGQPQVPIESFASELRTQRLLALRIQYPEIGHCVVVSGFLIAPKQSWIWVNDPSNASSGWYPFPEAISSFQNGTGGLRGYASDLLYV